MNDTPSANRPPADEIDRLHRRVVLLETLVADHRRTNAELRAVSEQWKSVLAAVPT